MRSTLVLAGSAFIALGVVFIALLLAAGMTRVFGVPEDAVTVTATGTALPEADQEQSLRIVTLLPRDAIPAIFDPRFVSAEEADERFFEADDLIIGLEIDGDARAYGIAHLSRHEIVNDVVGGKPVAVTW
jgi:hypothetical protein